MHLISKHTTHAITRKKSTATFKKVEIVMDGMSSLPYKLCLELTKLI